MNRTREQPPGLSCNNRFQSDFQGARQPSGRGLPAVREPSLKLSSNRGQINAGLRSAIVILLSVVTLAGCSTQPMTFDQEMVTTGVAAGVGALAGAAVGSQTKYSLPLSVFIGAAGVAGLVFLYEEVKREAAFYPLSSTNSGNSSNSDR